MVPLYPPQGALRLPCGYGPLVQVNGKRVPTEVTGTFADLLTSRPTRFTARKLVKPRRQAATGRSSPLRTCGTSSTPAPDSTAAQALAFAGRACGSPGPGSGLDLAAAHDPGGDCCPASFLVVPQNVNAVAGDLGGLLCGRVRLDGEQAWLLPAGSHGAVTLTYQPNTSYQRALACGLALVLLGLVALQLGGAAGWLRCRRWRWRGARAGLWPPCPWSRRGRRCRRTVAGYVSALGPGCGGWCGWS